MKKLLLLAAFGVAGMMSAKNESRMSVENFDAQIIMLGGWCEIRIYNSYGVLIDYSYTYENSEAACRSKAQLMLMAAPEAP